MGKKIAENSKAAAGKARKEDGKQAKQAATEAELRAKEEASWEDGAKGKGKKEDKAAKAAEKNAKKAEAAAMLAEEEKAIKAAKPRPAKAGKPAPTPTSITFAAPEPRDSDARSASASAATAAAAVPAYGASNVDDALDLLTTVNATQRAKETAAAQLDAHPERRAKAAFRAYEERRLPELRKENPSLRLSQVKELLFKEWQKSPENPMNGAALAYNATKEEKMQKLEELHEATQRRLRIS